MGLDLATYLAVAAEGTDKIPVLLSPTSQDPDPALATYCNRAGIALDCGRSPRLLDAREARHQRSVRRRADPR